MLWQVPHQWWKLCQKVVCGVYIKWQYTWFVIYLYIFLIAHWNLLSGQPSYIIIIRCHITRNITINYLFHKQRQHFIY
jgi:hypothetical protein